MPDDVVIADIGGQALDIFVHGPESAHKDGILKTFTHTSIPIHPCVLLKQTKSKILNSLNMILLLLVLFLSNVVGVDGQEAWQMLLTTAPRRRPSRLGQYSQNFFCRCVQNILQHFPTTMAFLTASRITFSCLASAAPHADSW